MARFKDMPMDPVQMVLYASSVDEAVPADSDVRGGNGWDQDSLCGIQEACL